MALKQVVLPAPLGPIRPRISPWRISNEAPARGTTPPNRSVASRSSSNGWVVVVSGTGGPLLELLERLVDLLGPDRPPRRQQALRAEVRQHHQQGAEDQHAVVGERPEQLGKVRHDDGPDDDA